MSNSETPNIILIENPAFGHPDYAVIRDLMYMVDKNMMMKIIDQPLLDNCNR